jgi:hypothetical protein
MARYTEKQCKIDVSYKNNYRIKLFNSNYFDVSPRNGYCAIDIYSIRSDGSLSCQSMLIGGTPKDCIQATYNYYEDKKVSTREQAKVLLGMGGIDFTMDYHELDADSTFMLYSLAKITKYKKPSNANGSLSRYFFSHLNKSKYSHLDKYIEQGKFRFLKA